MVKEEKERIWRKIFIFVMYFLSKDFDILVVFKIIRATTDYIQTSFQKATWSSLTFNSLIWKLKALDWMIWSLNVPERPLWNTSSILFFVYIISQFHCTNFHVCEKCLVDFTYGSVLKGISSLHEHWENITFSYHLEGRSTTPET